MRTRRLIFLRFFGAQVRTSCRWVTEIGMRISRNACCQEIAVRVLCKYPLMSGIVQSTPIMHEAATAVASSHPEVRLDGQGACPVLLRLDKAADCVELICEVDKNLAAPASMKRVEGGTP